MNHNKEERKTTCPAHLGTFMSISGVITPSGKKSLMYLMTTTSREPCLISFTWSSLQRFLKPGMRTMQSWSVGLVSMNLLRQLPVAHWPTLLHRTLQLVHACPRNLLVTAHLPPSTGLVIPQNQPTWQLLAELDSQLYGGHHLGQEHAKDHLSRRGARWHRWHTRWLETRWQVWHPFPWHHCLHHHCHVWQHASHRPNL